MKTKSLMIAVALFALVMGITASAYAVTAINPVASIDAKGAVNASSIAPSGVFYIVVQASDVTGITGAAMTLQYDKSKFDLVTSRLTNFSVVTGEVGRVTDVLSDTFGSFVPKDTAQGADNIRIANADATNGFVRFSGAFIDSVTGNSKLTGKGNLFAVRFKAKSTATGTGTFSLIKTVLSNASAGYDPATKTEAERTVPPLMKAASKVTDLTKFNNLTSSDGTGAFTPFADAEYTLGSTTVTIDAATGTDLTNNTVSITLSLAKGWNLVALSVVPDDAKLSTLFPGATAAFSYQGGKYVAATVLEAGLGYWVYLPAAQTYTITGVPLKKYSVKCDKKGWYLLAAPHGTGTPSVDVSGALGAIFKYGAGKYSSDTTMSGGNGYWVYINLPANFTTTGQ